MSTGEERDELAFQLGEHLLGHGVDWAVGWGGAGDELDLVVDRAYGGKGELGGGGGKGRSELGEEGIEPRGG